MFDIQVGIRIVKRMCRCAICLTVLHPQTGAAAEQANFTSSTTKDVTNNHFVVAVSNSGKEIISCNIKYSGVSFQTTQRSGDRPIRLNGTVTPNKPVVVYVQFGGFRTFTATVDCLNIERLQK